MPDRLKIQAVTVVPTLAPIIMPMAWLSCMTPELTKPTTMTVVAEELCMTAVTPRPRRNPLKGLEDSFSRRSLSLPPAFLSSPSPMADIP